MTAKHTPGQWHMSPTHLGRAFDIGAEDNANIALVHGIDGNSCENHPGEFEANAHLIAAAPELLEALEDLMFGAERGIQPHENYIVAARAAIAKAEGK